MRHLVVAALLLFAACSGEMTEDPPYAEPFEPEPESEPGVPTPDAGTTQDPPVPADPALPWDPPEPGDPTDPSDPSEPAAPLEPPTCETVNSRLLADFGLILKPGTLSFGGLASTDIDCAARIKVYQMFVAPFGYEGYRARLRPEQPITIHLYRSSDPAAGSCSGYVPNANAIQIRDLGACLRIVSGPDDPDFRSIAMFLIHETGHVIANRNSGLKPSFRDADLVTLDSACYDGGFLKTYAFRSGVRPVSESFAESVALFIGRRKRGRLGTIADFEAECPHTFDWVRTNVFEWTGP